MDLRLVVFMTLAFLASPAKSASALADEAFIRGANEAVDRIAREDSFSGVILVARGDQILLRRAAGLADRARNIPNTPETRFPLASVTKQFTAAAIMLLVEDGKIALADPISKYFPISKDFVASPPEWKDVTIKHLLTHSSGIGDKNTGNKNPALLFAPGTDYLCRSRPLEEGRRIAIAVISAKLKNGRASPRNSPNKSFYVRSRRADGHRARGWRTKRQLCHSRYEYRLSCHAMMPSAKGNRSGGGCGFDGFGGHYDASRRCRSGGA